MQTLLHAKDLIAHEDAILGRRMVILVLIVSVIWKGWSPVTVQVLLYPALILVLLVFLLVTVPHNAFRPLVSYGMVLGGLTDFFSNFVLGDLLRIASFKNLGIFNVSGQVFFAPLAWSLIVIFFLYYWPKENKRLSYFYVLVWAGLATAFSQVVYHADLFEYSPWFYPFPMLIIFLARFAFIAWIAKPWTNFWS
jgi:hypothetical protein